MCGTSAEFFLVAGDSDYHELTNQWIASGGSTSNHFAMLVESSEEATPFHLDSQCRLITSTGLVADAVWETAEDNNSALFFDTAQEHDEYDDLYKSDYGTCKAAEGRLHCSFGNAAEISICKASVDDDPDSSVSKVSSLPKKTC